MYARTKHEDNEVRETLAFRRLQTPVVRGVLKAADEKQLAEQVKQLQSSFFRNSGDTFGFLGPRFVLYWARVNRAVLVALAKEFPEDQSIAQVPRLEADQIEVVRPVSPLSE